MLELGQPPPLPDAEGSEGEESEDEHADLEAGIFRRTTDVGPETEQMKAWSPDSGEGSTGPGSLNAGEEDGAVD